MTTEDSTDQVSEQRRKIVLWAIVVTVVVLMAAAGGLLLWLKVKTGDPVFRNGSVEDERELVKILLDSYTSLITLVTAAFGAVAFLLTFQQSRPNTVPARAWLILTVGIVLLVLALFLAFVGREELLLMITRNAVEISAPVLGIMRWLCYLCTVIAAIMVSSFAVEVAVSSSRRTPHAHGAK